MTATVTARQKVGTSQGYRAKSNDGRTVTLMQGEAAGPWIPPSKASYIYVNMYRGKSLYILNEIVI